MVLVLVYSIKEEIFYHAAATPGVDEKKGTNTTNSVDEG